MKIMPDIPEFQTILVIGVAFIIGYSIISFIIYVLRRGREQQTTTSGFGAQKSFSQGQQDSTENEAHTHNTIKDEAYYGSILGLPLSFTLDDIRSKYRKLSAQYHPDKVNHLGPKLREVAEHEMKRINEAYWYFKKKYNL